MLIEVGNLLKFYLEELNKGNTKYQTYLS